jgi:hypothetical protein
MSMRSSLHRLASMMLVAVAACSSATSADRPANTSELVLSADISGVSPSTLSALAVTVTAPDIATPLIFNISIAAGTNVANGTIRIPPGDARTITIRGFDPTGLETYEGTATLSVKPGDNPGTSIPLLPLSGKVPITATLGSVTMTMTPGSATQYAATTLQLSTTITAPNGDVISATPDWATSNPALATVDQHGLVTFVAPGNVDIIAVYDGVPATAHLTVLNNALYQSNFDAQQVGPEWSATDPSMLALTRSPSGKIILGRLTNGTLTLTLTNIPPHQGLVVRFDLYILDSMDGYGETGGGGEVMDFGSPTFSYLHTNFTNMSGESQAYPSNIGGTHYGPGTGSVGDNPLGYTAKVSGAEISPVTHYAIGQDGSFTFAHTASSATLTFAASGIQPVTDESWAISNVVVTLK